MNNSLLHIIKNLIKADIFYNKYSFILNLIHVEKKIKRIFFVTVTKLPHSETKTSFVI